MRRLPQLNLPRWLLWLIAAPAILGPLAIFGFILRAELAHDEIRCPYILMERRDLGDAISVVEERRSCLPNLEERRFRVERPERVRILGKRRFEPAAFGDGYRWQAHVGDDDQVRVEVQHTDHQDTMFREGPDDPNAYE